eukprot:XP_028355634.1 uncharacterized protein LOC114487774 [Physeter catodon]
MRGASGDLTWSPGQDVGMLRVTEESLKEVTFHLRHNSCSNLCPSTVLPPCVSSEPLCGVGRSRVQGPWRVNNNRNNFKFTDIPCNQHQLLHQENKTLVLLQLPLTRNSSTWRRIASVTQSVDRSFSDQNPNPLPDGRPRISALVLGRPEGGRPLACGQWAPRRHPSCPFQPLEVGVPVDTGSTTVHCDRFSRAPCPPGAPSSDTSSVPLGARPCRLLRPGGRSQSLFHGSFKRKTRRPFPFHLLNDLIHEGLGHHGSQRGPVPGHFQFTALMELHEPHQALRWAPTEVARRGPRGHLARGLRLEGEGGRVCLIV